MSQRRILAQTVLLIATAAASAVVPAAGAEAGVRPHAASRIAGTAAKLSAVTVIPGSTGAWAVGETCGASAACPYGGPSLVLRWSGARWSKVKAPSPGGQVAITAVASSSRSDAWAVGSDAGSDPNLFLHWNGTTWRRVTGPGEDGEALTGVAVTSRANAWAVGSYQAPSLSLRTLVLHWNGHAWKKVASPDPVPGNDVLLGVAAISATDVWAVGYGLNTSTALSRTLILHWNGRAWTTIASPAVATLETQLAGVAVVSRSNAWAVGQHDDSSDFANPLILHWNGRSWARATVPGPGSNLEELFGVAATSVTSAWAVGGGPCVGGGADCPSHSLIMHWNGKTWAPVSSPSVASRSDQNSLTGIAATSGSNAWAVGSYYPAVEGAPVRALFLRWNGSGWKVQ